MHSVIYKSERKPDTYLYVEKAGDFARVPQELLVFLGTLTQVIELELTPERKLVRAQALDVLRQLQEQGYYLQLPPGKQL
jgi:uncharacterized protein